MDVTLPNVLVVSDSSERTFTRRSTSPPFQPGGGTSDIDEERRYRGGDDFGL